ncbi:hypothetical protein B5807_06196 [Epicoccum nigrum]|uniref:Uncharacterized protein n=1 Tax=Epicoccum nigrum TaxID=105696 RepID=A0A1Y2M0G9_EPING|nr:hypothetical protein B5807_06196 [Epicoccum nigrum]
MPPTLHPYLKRGLDFDASPIHPSDLVEDISTADHDEAHDTAKRRRVEAIALQCLQGKPPFILTAQFKGPFTGWRNPWAKHADRPGVQSRGGEEQALGRERRRSRTSKVASPEASRAAGHSEDDLYSEAELEYLPATAPIPEDDDLTGATEFFSVDTEEFIANNSPANPFWLRRPVASISFPPNSQTDKSPIKLRKRDDRFNSRKSLQLALPKEPLGGRSLPIRATPPDEWRSSASAPMDISSFAEAATPVQQVPEEDVSNTTPSADVPDSSRLRADSAQSEEARSSQAAQHAQTSVPAETPGGVLKDPNPVLLGEQAAHPQSFDSLVPATIYKDPSTIQVPQSSPLHRPTGFSSHHIQRSSEGVAGQVTRSVSELPPSPLDFKSIKETRLSKKLLHDLMASPAPASSTGFIYRRIGQSKYDSTSGSKIKPRAVSFNSSPSLKKKEEAQSGGEAEESTTAVAPEPPVEIPSAVSGTVEEVTQSFDNDSNEERDEQQESYKSRQSQYSTQAAMLLAQIEFQEDISQSSTSSATLRPWSQPAENTPPPLLAQPSPAITPLSVFNAHTDVSFSDLAGDSTLHGPSVSTQDLFAAASPFAFSTVKKKSERPRRTSLRFALTSNLSENLIAKCPTPSAERVPLKERNKTMSWSFTHDKPSQEPPKAASQHTTHDIGLPQLDFNTSLDFGPTTDFTDCFLKGLNNEP